MIMIRRPTPIYQHPQDLMLLVSRGEEVPDLTVLSERIIDIGAWRVKFSIVGQSHHVRVEHQRQVILDEVLACVSPSDASIIYQHSMATMQPHYYEHAAYHICVDFADRPAWEIPEDTENVLVYHFPEVYDSQPLTEVRWQVEHEGIRWWTLHTYAGYDETTHVHTASFFRFQIEEK